MTTVVAMLVAAWACYTAVQGARRIAWWRRVRRRIDREPEGYAECGGAWIRWRRPGDGGQP